jgi:hypothetical protein
VELFAQLTRLSCSSAFCHALDPVNPADTPLLLIAWRRPHALRQVIDAIRPVAPTRLYVACDGPSTERSGETEKVAATRQVIDQEIDWPCQIERRYSDENQGCHHGETRAMNWFFEQVEEGIILEDDCVPHPDFFPYCATLLERYRYDTRVWCISGDNFQNGRWRGEGSYYFSRYNHCWGWASWRRCWQLHDPTLSRWPLLRDSGLLEAIFEDPLERRYWAGIWQRLVDEGQPDTWDYQWTFTCLAHGGLTALPNRNLVRNVGFDSDAVHTRSAEAQPGSALHFVIQSTSALPGLPGPLRHPSFVLRHVAADRFEFEHKLGGLDLRRQRRLHRRLINGLRRRLPRFGV